MDRPLPVYHKSFTLAKMTLRTSRSKEAAAQAIITRDKLPGGEARLLVEEIFAQTAKDNKFNGLMYLLGCGALFTFFLLIFIWTGVLYYVILPFSLMSMLKGGYDLLFSDGFE